MPDSFNAFAYLGHLRGRWRLLALAPVAAGVVALSVSLLLPKQYTATARLLILPPGSLEERAPTAMSPVYLESLRTYEHVASSDSLFQKAVEEVGIRDSGNSTPLAALKQSVLEVEVPRQTKILEIRVTLPDPEKAQALAAYIASESARINQESNREADQARLEAAEELLAAARDRVEKARDRPASKSGGGEGLEPAAERFAELATAWWAYDEAQQRLAGSKAIVSARGERLQVIDSGVIPEQPSWPKIPLNTAAAFLFGLVLAFGYATAEYGLRRGQADRAGGSVSSGDE